jgi:hypothetical protein
MSDEEVEKKLYTLISRMEQSGEQYESYGQMKIADAHYWWASLFRRVIMGQSVVEAIEKEMGEKHMDALRESDMKLRDEFEKATGGEM